MPIENNYILEEDNVYLEVKTAKGQLVYFIIDPEFLDFAKSKIWYALYCPHRRMHYLESRDRIKYHRYITNCPDNMVVDHINRNTYDNRLVNLRICTVKENNNNRRVVRIHYNPKECKSTGIQYLSLFNGTYDVRFPMCKRYRTRNKNKALIYLQECREGLHRKEINE